MNNQDPGIIDLLVAQHIKDQNLDYNLLAKPFRQVVSDLEAVVKLLPNVVMLSLVIREHEGYCCMNCHVASVWTRIQETANGLKKRAELPANVVEIFPGSCSVH